jgi:hypothetical protein
VPSRSTRRDVAVDCGIRGGISAFALGVGLTLAKGHGELPSSVYHPTQPIAQLAVMVMATTTST